MKTGTCRWSSTTSWSTLNIHDVTERYDSLSNLRYVERNKVGKNSTKRYMVLRKVHKNLEQRVIR